MKKKLLIIIFIISIYACNETRYPCLNEKKNYNEICILKDFQGYKINECIAGHKAFFEHKSAYDHFYKLAFEKKGRYYVTKYAYSCAKGTSDTRIAVYIFYKKHMYNLRKEVISWMLGFDEIILGSNILYIDYNTIMMNKYEYDKFMKKHKKNITILNA